CFPFMAISSTRFLLFLLLSPFAVESKRSLSLASIRLISAINSSYEGLMRVLVGLKDSNSCLSEQKTLLREEIMSLSSCLIDAKK
ncbi:hypothetical protein PMAYCL1PPCAC_19268, partial [Pristionchus mayeri]